MFKVDEKRCVGCEVCVEFCPREAISMIDNKAVIDGNKCVDCGRCAQACPRRAIYPGVPSGQSFSPDREQVFPDPGSGMGFGMPVRPGGGGCGIGRGMGRGLGRGFGRGLRRGPREGKGSGKGGWI